MGLRIKIIFGLILFFIVFGLRIFCANCQQIENNNDDDDDDDDAQNDESRLHPQIWRITTTTIPSNFDLTSSETASYSNDFDNISSSWSNNNNNQPLRQRRPGLRKRKRRPSSQLYTTENSANSKEYWRGHVEDDSNNFHNENHDVVIHKPTTNWRTYTSHPSKYLQKTEKVREPLAALEKEQKLFELRNKQRQELETEATVTVRDKSYRKPYSQARLEVISSTQTSNQPTIDLKNILKNSGGLSLSEILQQKNLSLEDLLKGKQNALQALQMSTPSSVTESDSVFKNTKPVRRIPWSYLSSSTISPNTQHYEVSEINQINNEKFNSNESIISNDDKDNKDNQETKFKNEISSESTPNVVELATIVTLRDNPPIRNSYRKPVKHFVFPSIPKSKIFGGTTSSTKSTISSEEKEEIDKEVTYAVGNVEPMTTSTKRPNMTKNFLNDYYQNFKFQRPQIPKFTMNLSSKLHSSSSSSSSSSESNSREQTETFKTKILAATQQSSFDDIKSSHESVEEKLKKTKPNVNLIDEFSNFEDVDSKEVAKLEDLFDPSFQLSQTITPRVDKFTASSPNSRYIQSTSTQKLDVTETNPSLFANIATDQLDDDHTDILELMEDRRSSGRLFKILAQRNMTLEELIEHRRRGSSQLHLAEIMQNKTNTKPTSFKQTSASAPFDEKMDIVTAFETFPQFNLINLKSIKPDEIKTDSQGSSYFTSIIDIEPTDEIYKESRSVKIGKNDHEPRIQAHHQQQQQQQQQILLNSEPLSSTNSKNMKFLPQPWKTFSIASYTSQENNNFVDHSNNIAANRFISHLSSSNKGIAIDNSVLKIEDEVSRAHDLLDLELSGHGFKRNAILENTQMISNGIRSAIIASTVIVAVSLLVFLVIFVICRWKLNKRKKLSYTETYNAIKGRLPIISSTIGIGQSNNNNNCTLTNTTTNSSSPVNFGRTTTKMNNNNNNSKLNTMDPNSPEVQEYLFDTIRKQY